MKITLKNLKTVLIEQEMTKVAETELALSNIPDQDEEVQSLRLELRQKFDSLERLLLITEIMDFYMKKRPGTVTTPALKKKSHWDTGLWVSPMGGGAKCSDKQRAMGWKDEPKERRYFTRLGEALDREIINPQVADILADRSGIK